MFARMDRKKITNGRCLFITLTYEWLMRDDVRAKRDLKVFIERIQEKFKQAWIVWRMEEQRTGSIHFHLMVGNVGFWNAQEAQRAWNEVCGGSALNSLDIDRMRSYRGVRAYVSKYVAKETKHRVIWLNPKFDAMVAIMVMYRFRPMQAVLMGLAMSHIFSRFTDLVGRRWGVYGRKFVPYAPKKIVTVSANLYRYLIAVQQLQSKYAAWWQNFTILDDFAVWKAKRFAETLVSPGLGNGSLLLWSRTKQRYYDYTRWIFERASRINERIKKAEREECMFMAWAVERGVHRDYGIKVIGEQRHDMISAITETKEIAVQLPLL